MNASFTADCRQEGVQEFSECHDGQEEEKQGNGDGGERVENASAFSMLALVLGRFVKERVKEPLFPQRRFGGEEVPRCVDVRGLARNDFNRALVTNFSVKAVSVGIYQAMSIAAAAVCIEHVFAQRSSAFAFLIIIAIVVEDIRMDHEISICGKCQKMELLSERDNISTLLLTVFCNDEEHAREFRVVLCQFFAICRAQAPADGKTRACILGLIEKELHG